MSASRIESKGCMADDTMTAFLHDLKEREVRAKERLARIDGEYLYFGVIGLSAESDQLEFGAGARLRRVVDAPGEVEVAAALHLDDVSIYGSVARYARRIGLELAVRRLEDHRTTFTVGYVLISALRIRTLAEFLVPAVSDHSWSTLCGIKNQRCHIELLEDHPMFRGLEPPKLVTQGDADWVSRNTSQICRLMENPRFRLAADSLCSHQHLVNTRMMAAMLWSGVESLFSVTSELRFRLASFIAAALEERGDNRIRLYRQVKRLYDFRSKLVHGSSETEEAIIQHIIEVRRILSRLLCFFIEHDLPDDARLENMLFG